MNHAGEPDARLTRRAVVAAAWLAALGLAACGPGVGGSGTGREDLPGPTTPPTPAPPGPPPPAPVELRFADDGDGNRVQAQLLGDRLRVLAPCLGIDFDGTRSGSGTRFEGLLAADAARPANADAEVVGSALLLTLRDGTGLVLLGPLALVRNDTPPALAPCR